jgi:hypothetical protein
LATTPIASNWKRTDREDRFRSQNNHNHNNHNNHNHNHNNYNNNNNNRPRQYPATRKFPVVGTKGLSVAEHKRALSVLEMAWVTNADLRLAEYLAGINACVNLRVSDYRIPCWVFDKLKVRKETQQFAIPLAAYDLLLKYFWLLRLPEQGIEVVEYCRSTGVPLTEAMLSNIMVLLTTTPTNSETIPRLESLYNEYRARKVAKEITWKFSAQLYMKIAMAFCKGGLGQLSLEVLRDMTDSNHSPTPQLCDDLLITALFAADTKVLRVLASWYSNDFHARMEYGVVNRMLQIAASTGDGQLALVTFQVCECVCMCVVGVDCSLCLSRITAAARLMFDGD